MRRHHAVQVLCRESQFVRENCDVRLDPRIKILSLASPNGTKPPRKHGGGFAFTIRERHTLIQAHGPRVPQIFTKFTRFLDVTFMVRFWPQQIERHTAVKSQHMSCGRYRCPKYTCTRTIRRLECSAKERAFLSRRGWGVCNITKYAPEGDPATDFSNCCGCQRLCALCRGSQPMKKHKRFRRR